MRSKFKSIEKGVVMMLNTFDDWDLDFVGSEFLTAVGETPKEIPCVLKLHIDLESEPYIYKAHYEELMKYPADMVKLYMFNNTISNHLFWLDEMNINSKENKIKLNLEDAKISNSNI